MKNTKISSYWGIFFSLNCILMFATDSFSTVPVNNDFADAEEILTIGTLVTGSNENATAEIGEPDHDGNLSNSVWWKWQATESGTIYISTSGSNFNTIMAVYTASPIGDLAVDNLTLVNSNDYVNDDPFLTRLISFTTSAGTYYYIAVDGITDSWPVQGDVNLLILSDEFIYDDFLQAGAITSPDDIYYGLNFEATIEEGEPVHCVSDPDSISICDAEPNPASSGHNSHSIWWRWEAQSDGNYYLSTRGSDFDTVMAVYEGNSLDDLTFIARNDDNGNDTSSIIPFGAVSGSVYHIAIDGYDTEQGTVHLSIHPNKYLNDQFAAPYEINNLNQVYSGSNVGATIEDGEPDHAGHKNNSVWWRWSAPATGSYYITTAGSDFDTVLALYTGNSFADLPLIQENDDGPVGLTSFICFQATSDTEYRIAVDGYNISPELGEQGRISLMVSATVTGDLYFDGILDLNNAITGLQILSRMRPDGVSICGKLDSNTALGLPEVIYILDKLRTSP